jgi:TolA-binding protein
MVISGMFSRSSGYRWMASLVLAILVSVTPISLFAQEAASSVTADLVYQVQELQDEVRSLRGQLEEAQRELENIKRRQRDQYLDLDQRLSDIRNAQPISVVPQTQVQGDEVAVSQSAPPPDVPDVRPPMEEDAQTVGLGVPDVQSQTAPSTAAAEKDAYDNAFQALKELRYADAAQLFQDFRSQYPNSEYADNAQYWLGESYYVTRNYDICVAQDRLHPLRTGTVGPRQGRPDPGGAGLPKHHTGKAGSKPPEIHANGRTLLASSVGAVRWPRSFCRSDLVVAIPFCFISFSHDSSRFKIIP